MTRKRELLEGLHPQHDRQRHPHGDRTVTLAIGAGVDDHSAAPEASTVGRAEGERRHAELEMARLQRELDDVQTRLRQLQRENAALEEEAREGVHERNQIIEDGRKRRIRSGMHLASLIQERQTALHFACSYYLWAQVASEGAMARGAAELNKLTANVMDRERAASYDGFDYNSGAIDVAAVSREFGLASEPGEDSETLIPDWLRPTAGS